ncbi:MAG: hypothetical protein FH756_18890 [Firmicutes bacterium]|nr:hypothetical protein [Bacillota bacterium]
MNYSLIHIPSLRTKKPTVSYSEISLLSGYNEEPSCDWDLSFSSVTSPAQQLEQNLELLLHCPVPAAYPVLRLSREL